MKNSKHILKILSFILVLAIFITGCGQKLDEIEDKVEDKVDKVEEKVENKLENKDKKLEVNVGSLKGPTTISLAKMIEDEDDYDSDDLAHYNFEMFTMPEEIVTKLSNDELDIAAIPANLASTLYNKTEGKIQVAAINTFGVIYIVDNSDSINTINDLEGKTIYAVGKGTTPEGVLTTVLKENNIENVNIEFKQEPAEILAILASGEDKIAMLPEPFVSVVMNKNDKVKRKISMADEWKKINNNSEQVTGVLVARKEFIDNNPRIFKEFLEDYEDSIEDVIDDLDDVSKIVEQLGIIPQGLAYSSIPNIDIRYMDGNKMEDTLSNYLEKLFEFEPKLVGGQVPDEGFYYKK